MKVYKILRKINKQYFSGWVTEECKLEYKIGVETIPVEPTAILTFDSIENAELWEQKTRISPSVLVEGEGRRVKKPERPFANTSFDMLIKTAIAVWKNEYGNYCTMQWPKGTIAVKTFTPTKILNVY